MYCLPTNFQKRFWLMAPASGAVRLSRRSPRQLFVLHGGKRRIARRQVQRKPIALLLMPTGPHASAHLHLFSLPRFSTPSCQCASKSHRWNADGPCAAARAVVLNELLATIRSPLFDKLHAHDELLHWPRCQSGRVHDELARPWIRYRSEQRARRHDMAQHRDTAVLGRPATGARCRHGRVQSQSG